MDGCDGVFHVAAMMRFSAPEDREDYVRSNIIEPAVEGTLNLLQSCLRSKKPVRRLVFTSSISTLTSKDSEGKWRPLVDENCQTPIHHVWEKKASGWVVILPFDFTSSGSIISISCILSWNIDRSIPEPVYIFPVAGYWKPVDHLLLRSVMLLILQHFLYWGYRYMSCRRF